ncbi:MAG TPA: glycoside hydrolase family 43 protein, partial [Candidatus Acidoferrum sp.]|nr:glycoside hydrolase family 43 protein [Candidatus Acidoferrum sp.]
MLRFVMEAQLTAREAPRPAYENYFADPFVWRHDGEFFAIGTGEREATGYPGELVFPLLRSRDFICWNQAGRALLRPDGSLGTNFWAPEVVFEDGKFYLYYSVGFADAKHQLRVATSETPLGPFQDFGTALIDPGTCAFAIDAHAFRDDDGRWYLFYARDFLDTGVGVRAGTALAVAPMKSMTELSGEHRAVLRARHDWQRFQENRPIYGGSYDWHTLEGPFVRKHDGRYYCLYSAGRWENETYGVDYAVADHVLGPYSDAGNENGPRVLRTVSRDMLGPGHNSIVTGPDGGDWIVYHAWDAAMAARRMFIDRLVWTGDGPRCPRFGP